MSWALLSWAIATAAVIEPVDVPGGTDLVIRVEGALGAEIGGAVAELRPLLESWPGMTRLVEIWDGPWRAGLRRVLAAQGAKLDQRRAVVTVAIDLDATGGLLWSAVVSSALGKLSTLAPVEGETSFSIDEHPAARLTDQDLSWAVTRAGTLVVGDERGLQRHLRHLLGGLPPDEHLFRRAAQLRRSAPLLVVFQLPEVTRARLGQELPEVGALLGNVADGHLSATREQLQLVLGSTSEMQSALLHAVKGLVALLRGLPLLLEGASEGLQALDEVGSWPAGLPELVDASTVRELTTDWLAGFSLQAKVVARPPRAVHAELKVEKIRALALGALVLGARLEAQRTPPGLQEAQALLVALRQRQAVFKRKTGVFLACGPVPKEIPATPVAWPPGSCFEQLDFAPAGELRFQLLATIDKGRLTLVARSDLDHDGVPELWVLEEGRTRVRRLALEP